MTQEQIIEYNKLCAEFLGAEYCNDDIAEFPNGYYVSNNEQLDIPHLPEDMQFHSNWNWIMEVVENIINLKQDNWKSNVEFSIITDNLTGWIVWHKNIPEDPDQPQYFKEFLEGDLLINNVYECVIEFLKWYNANKISEN